MKIKDYPKKSHQPLNVPKLCYCGKDSSMGTHISLYLELQTKLWGLYHTCYNCYGVKYVGPLDSLSTVDLADQAISVIYTWLKESPRFSKRPKRESTIDFYKYIRLSSYLRFNFNCDSLTAYSVASGCIPDRKLLIQYIESLANSANNMERRICVKRNNLSRDGHSEREGLSEEGCSSLSE